MDLFLRLSINIPLEWNTFQDCQKVLKVTTYISTRQKMN